MMSKRRTAVMWRDRTDDELVAVFQEHRTNGAVEELLRRHEGAVRTVARKFFVAGGDQDDVRQQALIGFWKAVRDYAPGVGASFPSFARNCMERHVITAVKAANRLKHAPLTSSDRIAHHDTEPDLDSNGPKPVALPDISHETASVERMALDALEALPIALSQLEGLVATLGDDAVHDLLAARLAVASSDKATLPLSDNEAHVLVALVSGARYRDIAERMGKTEKFVDNTVQRLRRKIRAMLDEQHAAS